MKLIQGSTSILDYIFFWLLFKLVTYMFTFLTPKPVHILTFEVIKLVSMKDLFQLEMVVLIVYTKNLK